MKLLLLVFTLTLLGGSTVLFFTLSPPEKEIIPPPQELFVSRALDEWTPEGEKSPKENISSSTNPEKDETVTISGICSGNESTNFDCYEQYYKSLVNEKGIKAAFADLRTRYTGNLYVQSQCHPLTHVIGNAAAEKFKDVGEAFPEGDPFCWSGYYHGIIEGFIARVGRKNIANKINDVCATLAERERYSFDHYNCVHGLGHGVMASTNNELFEALILCDNVQEGWDRASCWSGVFMENVIIDGKNHFTKYLKGAADPIYPCNAVDEGYKQTCYLMQTSYMLKVNNGDFLKTFEWCREAEENHRTTCFQSLGRDASGRSISNVTMTTATCNLGRDNEEIKHCVIGAVKDFISYHHSDVQAKDLCNSFSDAEVKNTCLTTAETYYKVF